MVDISAIAAAMSSLKIAKDLAEAMIGLHDAKALDSKRLEFNQRMLDAQEKIFAAQQERTALIERIGALEKQIASFEKWDTEKEKYELKKIGPGAFAYMPKAGGDTGAPTHWLCTSCYENRKPSILQLQVHASSFSVYKCSACKAQVTLPIGRTPDDVAR